MPQRYPSLEGGTERVHETHAPMSAERKEEGANAPPIPKSRTIQFGRGPTKLNDVKRIEINARKGRRGDEMDGATLSSSLAGIRVQLL